MRPERVSVLLILSRRSATNRLALRKDPGPTAEIADPILLMLFLSAMFSTWLVRVSLLARADAIIHD